jgi:ribosomal protein L12E/L44/L45/RPP1/RPP2
MKDKTLVQEKMHTLIEMTAEFCDIHLDEDYKRLSEKLIRKMSRKRDVPFVYGRIEIWAAAVIYALGTTNLLFDKHFEPYIPPDTICTHFDTKSSTTYQKSKKIRDTFNIKHGDSEFSTQYIIENVIPHLRVQKELVISLRRLAKVLQEKDIQEITSEIKAIQKNKEKKENTEKKENKEDKEDKEKKENKEDKENIEDQQPQKQLKLTDFADKRRK